MPKEPFGVKKPDFFTFAGSLDTWKGKNMRAYLLPTALLAFLLALLPLVTLAITEISVS